VGVRVVSFDVSDGNSYGPGASHSVTVDPAPIVTPAVVPPPVVPPPVIPPVVVAPPPAPPPPPPAQPAVTTERPSGRAAEEGGETSSLITSVEATAVAASVGQHVAPAAAGISPVRLASLTVAPAAAGAEAEGGLVQVTERQVEARQLELFPSGGLRRQAETDEYISDLARLRDGLREQEDIQQRTAVTLAAGSLTMTLAYLLWLVRGGALAASILSAMPAWRLIDPLPVLARVDDEDDDEEAAQEDDQAVAPFLWEPEGDKLA